MKTTKIRDIPKYIQKKIFRADSLYCPSPSGKVRFYAYLTENDGELVKVTVAVKHYKKRLYCKQVAVHGVHSDKCFVRDMAFHFMGNYSVGWYAEGLTKTQRWYEDGSWGWHYDRYFDPYAPVVNKEYIPKFPEYRYSAYELYDSEDILKYLRLYEEFPQAEYLLKAGLTGYVHSQQILKKAGVDKGFRKWLIAHREELRERRYYIDVVLRGYRTGKPLGTLQAYRRAKLTLKNNDAFAPVRELFTGPERERFSDYISKQNTNVNTYLDYLKACRYLGLDMSLPKNRFPHDFRYWHDMRIDQYAAARTEADRKEKRELYEKFACIAEKYMPLEYDRRGEFICIIARSPAELVREGEALRHCVGRMNYDRRMLREESLIFFVRIKEQPDVPFVTVEYSPASRKILQCYGECDSNPGDDVLRYVNKVWLPHANRKLKEITKAA